MWKLLKHDLNNTKKKFLILFAIFFGICLISPLSNFLTVNSSSQDYGFSGVFAGLIISLSVTGFMVLAILVAVYSFKYLVNSLFSKQGYLTFTLPYKVSQIVLSKILTVIIWQVCFSLVAIVGGTIMHLLNSVILAPVLGESYLELPITIIKEIINALTSISTAYTPWQIVIAVLSSIISFPLTIILILLSFTLINSSSIGSNSKWIAILLFFGFSYGLSTVSQILMRIFALVEPNILPLAIDFILSLGALIGGYKWATYLLEYRLELS